MITYWLLFDWEPVDVQNTGDIYYVLKLKFQYSIFSILLR